MNKEEMFGTYLCNLIVIEFSLISNLTANITIPI